MSSEHSAVSVRVVHPGDEARIRDLVHRSYRSVLPGWYAPEVLDAALPKFLEAVPALVRSGTFYLAVGGRGEAVGCGGWTLRRPGGLAAGDDPEVGHLRLFATHPDWSRRGIGRLLFGCCLAEARAAAMRRLACQSSLAAAAFYRSLGFSADGAIAIPLAEGLDFSAVCMTYRITPVQNQ